MRTYEISNKALHIEKPLNKFLGEKIRINTISEMRNGLPSHVPGDKMYKNPECTTGFFKEGGLIVGSSNRSQKTSLAKRMPNFYETIDLKVKTLDPNKLWKNKVKQEELNFQTNMVKDLGQWEENILNVRVPPPQINNNPKVVTQKVSSPVKKK